MTEHDLRKLVNRQRESDGNTFQKIYSDLIDTQDRVELIRYLIAQEKQKEKPDSHELDILNSRLITALREHAAAKQKHGIKG